MKRILTAALVSALVLPGISLASEDRIPDSTKAQITERLTADGYEVRKMKMEDGKIEVYALKGGDRFELYFDPSTHELVATKKDD